MKSRLFDNAAERDFLLLRVDRESYFVRRPISDSTVQRINQSAGLGIEIGRAITLQTAADEELIEAVKPTQAARLAQIHKRRMHRAADRRFPADARDLTIACDVNCMDSHATRWHHI